MKTIKIALIQMCVAEDKSVNLEKAGKMITEAARQGAEIVMLPEMFTTPYRNDFFPLYAEVCPGHTTGRMGQWASENEVCLIGGSIPEKENGKIFNTCFVFDQTGQIIGRHRKMHLFDIDVKGGIRFMESETLSPGETVTVCDTPFGRIGVAICFDMRFPELMRLMVDAGAQMIFIPAAFNMTTGPAHWHVTARMRAVDNQVFFGVASPARDENASYVAFGHSMLCDPWGQIVAEAGAQECIVFATADLQKVKDIREQLPLLKARRKDVYSLKDVRME